MSIKQSQSTETEIDLSTDLGQIQIHLGGQGRVGGSRARVDEAEGGRKGRARGLRRDTFPDGKSALMLVAARLKYVADSEWGSRRYLDASLVNE